MVALLDVNVLIALIDPAHKFHRTAKAWALEHALSGWASCPLTQNGCIRIISQPSYQQPVPLRQAIQTLQVLCQSRQHQFWPDDLSLLDAARFEHSKIHGHRQLTDLYLLALAVQHQGCFVSLDGAITLSAVKGAKKHHLLVL
jgi:uncharacterized protein